MSEEPLVHFHIDSLAKSGEGVAQLQGKDRVFPLLVPDTLPGEEGLGYVRKIRSERILNPIEQLTVVSPDRVQAPCPHFGKCGGCQWQHVAYSRQLIEKEQRVLTALQKFITDSTTVYPILGSPQEWHYRNKMELTFSQDRSGEKFLGLMLRKSRGRVFHLNECHLAPHWMEEAIENVRLWWKNSSLNAYHLSSDTGSLRTLILREGQTTNDRLAMLTVSGRADYALSKNDLDGWVRSFDSCKPPEGQGHLSLFLRIQQIRKGHPTQFYEMHLGGPDHLREQIQLDVNANQRTISFKIAPTAFFQPNTRQARNIYLRTIAMAEASPTDHLFDLYCGAGTFGLCFAPYVAKVTGIELNRAAVLDGRDNLQFNGVTNGILYEGDVGKLLQTVVEERGLPDLVLVDPPRSGLEHSALTQIVSLGASKIIYVSCNPDTQARDLEFLIRSGYSLSAVQPIDQFPQTVHVENITILKRLST